MVPPPMLLWWPLLLEPADRVAAALFLEIFSGLNVRAPSVAWSPSKADTKKMTCRMCPDYKMCV
jgi:hypothetical protein